MLDHASATSCLTPSSDPELLPLSHNDTALLAIQDTGLTSSEAVRAALLREAARVRSKESQRAEFLAAQADPEEQRILRESFEFMETIDGPW